MDKVTLAYFAYSVIIIIMMGSALWVLADSRKRGRPWGETLAWAMFVGAFFGLGLLFYLYWNRKFN